ncbi:MAG: N-acetylmuramoyl-L-alanine amidase [Gemmatimonadales bacterium]|nr:MAG: N-acetylmuramoyl-L-alanine amidase [Gemmatimonadales bacterium]
MVLHWTGGGPEPNETDLGAYHALVGQSCRIYAGVPIAANMRRIPPQASRSEYAAHTRGLNSWSVGVALCGMMGAKEGGPYGPHPITEEQAYTAIGLVAAMVRTAGLPVTAETVLTHWEVQRVMGVAQPGKWDITVLPWITDPPLQPDEVGSWIRQHVSAAIISPTDYLPEIRPLRADPQRPHGTPPWRKPLGPAE